MNTTRLKSFATEARNTLRRGVMNRLLALGFDQDGNVVQEPTMFEGGAVFMGETISEDFYNKWISLRDRIASHSLREVLEEAAYTWFNRLMAIRIMQKNGLIDPVLDYRSNSVRLPILLTNAQAGNIPTMPQEDYDRLLELFNDPTRTAEQFAILITAFCHNTPVINACFGKLADYTELLLPNDILEENGFLDKLNHTDFINDEDYTSPELIGWLYQFYISERKDEVFAKSGKYDSDEIPAATQIFTPNWIVKYMVQNTVGRIYLDNNPYEDELKSKWKYLVEPSSTSIIEGAGGSMTNILEIDSLVELKVADLACGSGHILNECFDLLLDLYINEGYNRRQSIESIFTNNLTGVDIDTRAKQLATFALLLKACQNDKSFVDAHVMPHVLDMPDVNRYTWRDLNGHMACALQLQGASESVYKEINECFTLMENANSFGSIMKFDISPETREFIHLCLEEQKRQQKFIESFTDLFLGFEIILALTEKYSALVMNPPYMGSGRFEASLAKYIKDNYEEGKSDLFSTFMILAIDRLIECGKYGMINMHSWMFLSSFEKLRKTIIEEETIDSLLHLGTRTFDELSGEVVQNAAFVITNSKPYKQFSEYNNKEDVDRIIRQYKSGTYFRLVDGRDCADKEQIFLDANKNQTIGVYFSKIQQSNFGNIPGFLIGYWVSEHFISLFANNSLGTELTTREGMATADNDRFLRNWFEISTTKFSKLSPSSDKWYPYNKGGTFRKWYGNRDYVVNWQNDGEEIRNNIDPRTGRIRSHNYNGNYAFRECITWSAISSGSIAIRYCEDGFLWDSKGACGFSNVSLKYSLGLINSEVADHFLKLLSPTMDFKVGDIIRIPLIKDNTTAIENVVSKSIAISREDWNAHETSWNFQRNELIAIDEQAYWDILNDYCNYTQRYVEPPAQIEIQSQLQSLSWLTYFYETKWEIKFRQLHANEEELNRLFIEIYGLQDELKPDVPLDDVTILQQGEISIENSEIVWHDDVIMKQLISYAVGCWMGRYRLDKPGLHIAHTGATREEIAPYEYNGELFDIDDDGIIPLMPKDCMFHDNAVQRLADFVRQVFGASTQIENLNFIEDALGMTVEQYFIKQFWKDHKKMYQNRPIYWLFSSKKGAFQCLAYMHRMDAYTVERVRQKYLLPHMEDLRRRIAELAERAASLNTQERKTLESLNKQLDECMEYHDRLHPVADKQIAFDLDDGVVVNYAKFGDILAKLK